MEKIRSIKKFFVRLAILFVVLFFASLFGIVQFHYPRAVENDPLLAPVKVETILGETIVLEDGRSLHIDYFGSEPLEEVIEGSDYRVDIETESVGEHSMTTIYVKHRSWICGTSWVAFINIPLIPDDIPINHRKNIGWAKSAVVQTELLRPDLWQADSSNVTNENYLIVDELGHIVPYIADESATPIMTNRECFSSDQIWPVELTKGMTLAKALAILNADEFKPWDDVYVSGQYKKFRKQWRDGYHYVIFRMGDEGRVTEFENFYVTEFWNDS